MFVQLFRNKIYESRKFKYRIRKLGSYIWANKSKREPHIVKGLADLWNSQDDIYLGDFQFAGDDYKLFVEFYQLMTHGPPCIAVSDKVSVSSQEIEYKTEYGDLAFIVDYWLENSLLSRRISILQTKKEKSKDKAEIELHQQYLMQFWPKVEISQMTKTPLKISFPRVDPDEFSFYHFILNKHRGGIYSSSICSAPFVGLALGTSRYSIEKSLVSWCNQKKTRPHTPPPSLMLSMPLLPGKIYKYGKYYEWNMLPKPFYEFILDAAYLHIGTNQPSVLTVAFERVKKIIAMKVVGGRKGREFRNRLQDIYESRTKEDNSQRDTFIFT